VLPDRVSRRGGEKTASRDPRWVGQPTPHTAAWTGGTADAAPSPWDARPAYGRLEASPGGGCMRFSAETLVLERRAMLNE
jgi:hypothetical protein